MKTPILPLLIAAAAAVFATAPLLAALPDTVPYQGRIAANGTAYTGTGYFKLAVYQHTTGSFTPAAATATVTSGFLTSIAVASGGSGYSALGVTVSFTGGGGSGANATATVVNGVITAITVTNPGSGYTGSPTVVLNDPASPAQLWNNAAGATTGALSEPASSVSLPVTNGLFALGLGDTASANMAALPASLAPVAGQRAFVRVWFSTTGAAGSFQALAPDTELRSVPFAREAGSIGGIASANLPQLNAANTFTNVNGLTVQGAGPNISLWPFVAATGATVPLSGAGTRLEFLPGYSAFRAGTVLGTQWDAGSIGLYSTAIGLNTTASGISSTALGSGTTANADYSTALGSGTTANAVYSTALGYQTTASGLISTAMGSYTQASGDTSTALGGYTRASGSTSTALGSGTTASGLISTAMGSLTTASGAVSSALGFGTIASGATSTALGYQTTASGDFSTAMGFRTTAQSYGETAIGCYNTDYIPANPSDWNTADRLFVVGNGTVSARSDALVVYKNGNATLKGDLSAKSFVTTSDRNRKTDIVPADTAAVLAGVAALPIATWKFKEETVTHLGPMAQDFAAAFHLGSTDTGIATVDADGVALAAIQELAKQNTALKSEVAELKARLTAIEAKLAK